MTLSGLYLPLITPFDSDGEIAIDALEKLSRGVLDKGATGLVALGTTGEPAALTEDEQRTVVEVAAGVCRERGAQLIVGANTAQALQGLREVDGVAAAMSLVPPFLRPGEAGVLAHFEHLAAVGVPLVAYHVPYRTGQALSASALRRLAAIPGVIGVKYAVGGIDAETVALLAVPPPGWAVLGGDDPFLSPLLALGAHGGITASAHVATEHFAALVAAWRDGRARVAARLGHCLSMLSTALFAEPNPAVIKAVLHARGEIPTPAVRLPLVAASADTTKTALRLLEELPVVDGAVEEAVDR
jgi:4-hydroxy-tetrahydrodipicolinate synthase